MQCGKDARDLRGKVPLLLILAMSHPAAVPLLELVRLRCKSVECDITVTQLASVSQAVLRAT